MSDNDDNRDYAKGDLCSICQEAIARKLFCANGHYFCNDCIKRWETEGRTDCPVCRGRYEPFEPLDIDNEGYGQYRNSLGYVNAPVDIGLVRDYEYKDCCTPCKKTCMGKLFCGRPSCRGCIKNSKGIIVGIDNEEHYCKKDGQNDGGKDDYTLPSISNIGGGKRRKKKTRRKKIKQKKRTRKKKGGMKKRHDTGKKIFKYNPHNKEHPKNKFNIGETVKMITPLTDNECLFFTYMIDDLTDEKCKELHEDIWEVTKVETDIFNDYTYNIKNKNNFELLARPEETLSKWIEGRTVSIGGRKKTRKKDKRQFLYNPNDPSKSFDVYIDKNPNDTIPIKYTSVEDVEKTIKKLERLYKTKKYTHKRIWQVGMIMKVRLEAMNKYKKTKFKKAKHVNKRYQLAKKYFKFLGNRTKKKTFLERKKMLFKLNKTKKKTRRKRVRNVRRKTRNRGK